MCGIKINIVGGRDIEMFFKVHSLRVEHYRSYNDWIEDYEDIKIYILNCLTSPYNHEKYELEIYTSNGSCASEYCSASWGHKKLRKVDSFVGMTHKPKKDLYFHIDENNIYDIKNEIFQVSYNDGDEWYPGGYGRVNMDLFIPTVREKEKRPVWIFKGESGLGKSYLAGIIKNTDRMKNVYETDAYENLTDINEDIIVVGNKYQHSMKDILKHIQGEHEVIFVDFSKMQ